jgi:hypothetical protein
MQKALIGSGRSGGTASIYLAHETKTHRLALHIWACSRKNKKKITLLHGESAAWRSQSQAHSSWIRAKVTCISLGSVWPYGHFGSKNTVGSFFLKEGISNVIY